MMTSLESFALRFWRTLILRGIVAIVFGVLTLIWPGVTLGALVLLFGVYAVVDGVSAIVLGFKEHGERPHWWATLLGGVISLAAGLVTFITPGITAIMLLSLIAAWAILRGVFEIVVAIRLRHVIDGEWLLLVSGVLSILFGIAMLLFPGAGALALIVWIGVFAIVLGAVLVTLGFRVRGVLTHASVGV